MLAVQSRTTTCLVLPVERTTPQAPAVTVPRDNDPPSFQVFNSTFKPPEESENAAARLAAGSHRRIDSEVTTKDVITVDDQNRRGQRGSLWSRANRQHSSSSVSYARSKNCLALSTFPPSNERCTTARSSRTKRTTSLTALRDEMLRSSRASLTSEPSTASPELTRASSTSRGLASDLTQYCSSTIDARQARLSAPSRHRHQVR